MRLARGDLAPDDLLINDRDLAEASTHAHFTLNFDKRYRWKAHNKAKKVVFGEIAISTPSCLIWKVVQKCPLLRSNDLTPPGTKDP